MNTLDVSFIDVSNNPFRFEVDELTGDEYINLQKSISITYLNVFGEKRHIFGVLPTLRIEGSKAGMTDIAAHIGRIVYSV